MRDLSTCEAVALVDAFMDLSMILSNHLTEHDKELVQRAKEMAIQALEKTPEEVSA